MRLSRLYRDEPVPRPLSDAGDELVEPPEPSAMPAGDSSRNVPIASLPYARPQFGTLLSLPPQDADIGLEVPQAGAGRAVIPARVALPVQGPMPLPEGRRIARPMPTSAPDAAQVIQPGEAGYRG